MNFVFGAGHLLSTAPDLHRFALALNDPSVLPRGFRDAFFHRVGWTVQETPIGQTSRRIGGNYLSGSINGFTYAGQWAMFWSSTEANEERAYHHGVDSDGQEDRFVALKSARIHVRCARDPGVKPGQGPSASPRRTSDWPRSPSSTLALRDSRPRKLWKRFRLPLWLKEIPFFESSRPPGEALFPYP